jgi:protein phosphatase
VKVPAGLRVGVCSHTGLVRGANEDDFLVTAPPNDEGGVFLAAVADGMGGAVGGAEASRTALRALGVDLVEGPRGQAREERMRAGFEEAHARVLESAAAVPALREMGTTMTALWLWSGSGVVGHIGDSRLYRVRDGGCEQLTTDHSVQQGESLLTRCIGAGRPACEPEALAVEVVAGDRFVLCTDGVWNVVPSDAFAALAAAPEPQRAAEELVRSALDAGGPDNATVVVVDAVDLADAACVEVDLPRRERPDARSLWPEAPSLRRPRWPLLLLLLALSLLAWSSADWFGFDPFSSWGG